MPPTPMILISRIASSSDSPRSFENVYTFPRERLCMASPARPPSGVGSANVWSTCEGCPLSDWSMKSSDEPRVFVHVRKANGFTLIPAWFSLVKDATCARSSVNCVEYVYGGSLSPIERVGSSANFDAKTARNGSNASGVYEGGGLCVMLGQLVLNSIPMRHGPPAFKSPILVRKAATRDIIVSSSRVSDEVILMTIGFEDPSSVKICSAHSRYLDRG